LPYTPPGKYTLAATLTGFKTATVADVRVDFDRSTTVDFFLEVRCVATICYVDFGWPATIREARAVAYVEIERSEPPSESNCNVSTRHSVRIHESVVRDGVRLPQEGPGWTTWDPALDRSPNREWRLFGTEELVRTLLTVIREYRDAHAEAPRVVIGDMSRKGGGPLDQHHSHQNGLDVDIYYPRLDHRPEEPTSIDQIDVRLAQDLVDRFVAAGAEFVFVGPSTPLIGPPSVVQKLANHDTPMHVRIRPA
jgi:hypothetical protein